MTPDDLADLARCESVLEKHLAQYPIVGKALTRIRDRQLYRQDFDTFEDYVADRWKMDRNHAYRLMAAAQVAENLQPRGDTPQTERQARPLAALSPADQAAAWQDAQTTAGTAQPSASVVAAAVAKRHPKKQKKAKRPKPLRLRLPSGIVVIEPGRNFQSAEQTLEEALAKIRGVALPAAA